MAVFSFLSILLIYFREIEQTQAGWKAEAEGKAHSPVNREPDAGLDHRTPGSWPEVKADA